VTSLVIERFGMGATSRLQRAIADVDERIGEVLAGRTVWCAVGLPNATHAADDLRARLEGVGPDVAAAPLVVAGGEALSSLAQLLDRALTGGDFDPAAADLLARSAAVRGDELVGAEIRAGDVVIAHDPLSVMAAEAVRERGAHALWNVRVGAEVATAAGQAFDLMRRITSGVDAYVLAWRERSWRGQRTECVAAAIPAAAIVVAKQFPPALDPENPRRLAWRMTVAETVRSDREECVVGRLHPKPVVAAR
jgi:hypothetical protein